MKYEDPDNIDIEELPEIAGQEKGWVLHRLDYPHRGCPCRRVAGLQNHLGKRPHY